MALKTVLFAALFAVCVCGSLLTPILGVLGYVGHYSVGPERQWWAVQINSLGIRYSLTLAVVTAVGMVMHWQSLKFGNWTIGSERLVLAFLAVVWLGTLLGVTTVGRFTTVDHPAVKFTKVILFAMMMTHVVTNVKNLDRLLWVLVAGVLVLGLQAYGLPRRAFASGRLNTVGGPDFAESNFLAAYLAAMIPLIAVMFLKSKWIGKCVSLAAGVFAMNAIVLTRSRGALVGLACGGLVAAGLSPKKHRAKIFAGMIVVAIGGFYLSDEQFRRRMTTITRKEDQRDRSAQSRVEIWRGGLKMAMANKMGVGPGNFYQSIGKYAPEHPGRDAHNTYIRCAAELGFGGLGLFLLIVLWALVTLRKLTKRARDLPPPYSDRFVYMSYGLTVSLCILLGCFMTMTLLYMEAVWWLLLLPVCLRRAMDNLPADAGFEEARASQEMARLVDNASPGVAPPRRKGAGWRGGHVQDGVSEGAKRP